MTKEAQKQSSIDTSLIGKPVDELTPAELGQLSSQLASITAEIDTRRKAIVDQVKDAEDKKLAEAGKAYAQALGWAKFPKVQLIPNADGTDYTVAYVAKGRKNGGKRAAPDVNGGSVTINKIGIAMGGIAWFRDSDGKEYEGIKDLVKSLKQADGSSESSRCWDISKKGISASDIVTKYHADKITLVFNDGTEKLVKDAVEEMKAARATA